MILLNSSSINGAGEKQLILSPDAKMPSDELMEFLYDCDLAVLENDIVPIPWDSDIQIEGSNLRLVGTAGPSGYGKCILEVPLEIATKVINIRIYLRGNESSEKMNELSELGWTFE